MESATERTLRKSFAGFRDLGNKFREFVNQVVKQNAAVRNQFPYEAPMEIHYRKGFGDTNMLAFYATVQAI